MITRDVGATRFRIKHSTLGYLKSIRRTDNDSMKYAETWTKAAHEAVTYTMEEIRRPMDANGYGLMGILVSSYTQLKLDKVLKPSLELASER